MLKWLKRKLIIREINKEIELRKEMLKDMKGRWGMLACGSDYYEVIGSLEDRLKLLYDIKYKIKHGLMEV